MTTAAKNTFGNKVFMNPAPAPAATAIAELLDFDPPSPTRGTIDATTHDSPGGAEEVITEGTYDPGELKFKMNYIARSVGDIGLTLALTGGALQNVKLQVKTAVGFEDQTFTGYLTAYGPDSQPVKGKQTSSATLKISGAVTKAAAA